MLLELVKGFALIGFDHVRNKLFGMDIQDFGVRLVLQQLVAHSMHQMGFAKPDPAIDEKRVVQLPRYICDVHGSSPRHAIGCALDQAVKTQAAIEPVFEDI